MYTHGRGRLICYEFLVLCCLIDLSFGNYVINVEHKFGGRHSEKRTLSALRAHDQRRHGRSLSAVDLPLGGSGPKGDGLYFAKIGLGTPSKDYYLHIDTGSHITWVNCAGCENCPKQSGLEIPMTLYDPNESKTAKKVTCEEKLCPTFEEANTYKNSSCKNGEMCPMNIRYGVGNTSGYYVTDTIHLNKASGDLKTIPMDDVVTFGCGTSVSKIATGGMIGLGISDISIISQLASAGKVKKTYAQCLDDDGGGTFAIGEVEEPKVKSVPYIEKADDVTFNIRMMGVEVNQKPLNLSSKTLDPKNGTLTAMDSGTTMGYLDEELYKALLKQILDSRPGLTVMQSGFFQCFKFDGNVDDTFPTVTFRFENSLYLKFSPHDYLLPQNDLLCFSWATNKQLGVREKHSQNLFGDMAMGNKLFVYDMEKKTIGWTDYNCSLGVKVKDGQSKDQYLVGSHDLSHILAPSPAMSP